MALREVINRNIFYYQILSSTFRRRERDSLRILVLIAFIWNHVLYPIHVFNKEFLRRP